VADGLRANSNLASNEYFMPIVGLIFLRYATNRFYEAKAAIDADKATGRMPDRPLIQADSTRRRALMLPEAARYDVLLRVPKDSNLGEAVTKAMEAVKDAFPHLPGSCRTTTSASRALSLKKCCALSTPKVFVRHLAGLIGAFRMVILSRSFRCLRSKARRVLFVAHH
jgi:hypothetical protein